MKTLHKYLVGQVGATLLLTVAVFTAVLLVGNALREILTLLASSHVSPLLMVKAFVYLIPFVWVFALPMGMLTATLLVFGRFSADQELTAARASGISLISLVMPVLLLSLFCCTLSAWFNMDLGPRCRVAYIQLIQDVKSELVNAQIPEGRFIRDFPGYIFYTEKNNGGKLENVMIYRLQNETNVDTTVRAVRGELKPDRANNQLVLDLYDARIIKVGDGGNSIYSSPTLSLNLSLNAVTNKVVKPKISDMTFLQLRQELRNLENLNVAATLTTTTNVSAELKAQMAVLQRQQKDFVEPVRVAMHREVAFSFACFGFTLVGIPLGIRVHRRETNIGIAIALGLVVVYYAFIMLAASLSGRPEFYPHLILWLPNFLFQAVGAVLLWRANKGI
ncbi:MAG TPA: LptF/LptG family permease [bacterium]|nr:LptF/LptG family permease [bacterium]